MPELRLPGQPLFGSLVHVHYVSIFNYMLICYFFHRHLTLVSTQDAHSVPDSSLVSVFPLQVGFQSSPLFSSLAPSAPVRSLPHCHSGYKSQFLFSILSPVSNHSLHIPLGSLPQSAPFPTCIRFSCSPFCIWVKRLPSSCCLGSSRGTLESTGSIISLLSIPGPSSNVASSSWTITAGKVLYNPYTIGLEHASKDGIFRGEFSCQTVTNLEVAFAKWDFWKVYDLAKFRQIFTAMAKGTFLIQRSSPCHRRARASARKDFF